MRPNPAIAAIALSLLVASCSSQAGAAGAGTKVVPAAVSPLDGKQFYPDPKSNAAVEYRRLLAQGRQDEANEIKSLASTPSAIWFGGRDNPYARVDRILTAATKARQVPILVVYNVPGRDCGLYSAGGLAGIDPYLRWVGSFAAASKGREAIVILEPDAVPQSLSGCNENASSERHRTLELAVDILKRQPGLRVYLDAGNATWIKDQDRLATALRASGVAKSDGFALNVSNFATTRASTRYGQALSRRLGGKSFVVDISRNGAGAPPNSSDHSSWCNPVSARLGNPPTTRSGLPGVDALLWIKHPGDSDGPCRPGAPAAGQWYPELALQLVS